MQTACVFSLVIFAAPPERGRHEDEGYANVVSLHPAYVHQLDRVRASDLSGHEAPDTDDLGGFVLSYERVLYRHWLALELSKPFYFELDRFDSPFEVLLRFQHRWGRVEPFVAAGLSWNIRVFRSEREDIEGTANALSFGLATATGLDVWVSKHWALEASFSYVWVVLGEVVAHELAFGMGPLVAF